MKSLQQDLSPYLKGHLSKDKFFKNRKKLSELYKSESFFLNKEFILPGDKILDIGCSSGNLGKILIDEIEKSVQYVGIDVNSKAIDLGKDNNQYNNVKLISGSFPSDLNDEIFDYVCVFNLFEQIQDWKSFLIDLTNHAKKYINISCTLKLTGNTIVDIDTSYGYYFDSGSRVHKIVHNIYELFNFCAISEIGLKKLWFYGYNIESSFEQTGDFRALSNKEQIRGNLLLELHPKDVELIRIGANTQKKSTDKKLIIENKPQYSIIINGKPFHL